MLRLHTQKRYLKREKEKRKTDNYKTLNQESVIIVKFTRAGNFVAILFFIIKEMKKIGIPTTALSE